MLYSIDLTFDEKKYIPEAESFAADLRPLQSTLAEILKDPALDQRNLRALKAYDKKFSKAVAKLEKRNAEAAPFLSQERSKRRTRSRIELVDAAADAFFVFANLNDCMQDASLETRMALAPVMDQVPVLNAKYKEFIEETGKLISDHREEFDGRTSLAFAGTTMIAGGALSAGTTTALSQVCHVDNKFIYPEYCVALAGVPIRYAAVGRRNLRERSLANTIDRHLSREQIPARVSLEEDERGLDR